MEVFCSGNHQANTHEFLIYTEKERGSHYQLLMSVLRLMFYDRGPSHFIQFSYFSKHPTLKVDDILEYLTLRVPGDTYATMHPNYITAVAYCTTTKMLA